MENFIISPEYFLAVKQNKYKKEESGSMKKGSIKHKMILEKEDFYKDYFIQTEPLSSKQKEFIDNIISAKNKFPMMENSMLDEIHKAVYTTSKKDDGVNLAKKLMERIEAEEKNLIPITRAEWMSAKRASEIFESSPSASKLLEYAIIREQEFYFNYKDLLCRAKIDGCGISSEEKDVGIILDLKTHDMPISQNEFIQRMNDKGIKRQLTFYELAIKNTPGYSELFKDVKLLRKFVISVDPVAVRIYEISEESAMEQRTKIDSILDEIKYCIDNNAWRKKSESWTLV